MQITISLEELRAFEETYKKWANSDGHLFIAAFHRMKDVERESLIPFLKTLLSEVKVEREQWLKRNPEPKLIPSV